MTKKTVKRTPASTVKSTPRGQVAQLRRTPCELLQSAESFSSDNHWWQNWPKTHAYVAKRMFFPTSVYEIASAIMAAENDGVPLRAVGGGWSFSDASLPGTVSTNRPDGNALEMLAETLPLVEGLPEGLFPAVNAVDVNKIVSLGGPRWGTNSGDVYLQALKESISSILAKPQPESAYLINTRSLVSSLQQQLPDILSAKARDAISAVPKDGTEQRFYFHVEAGITMEELSQLLEHQSPRLDIQASGGSPGATLAGALSTGTHGGEFNWPLLIDRVKAVHLVGPGGLQWWIEGDDSIADASTLLVAYPCLVKERIIAGTSPIAGIRPQDWLNAIVVSMGCMGVVYSVVLEVFPLLGVHQKTIQLKWSDLLAKVGSQSDTVVPALIAGLRNPVAHPLAPGVAEKFSENFVEVLTDGDLNGTGIPKFDQNGRAVNQYADLALNPIPLANGDYDCWILNREAVDIPLDPQPAGEANPIGGIIQGIVKAFSAPNVVTRLEQVFGLANPDSSWLLGGPILLNALGLPFLSAVPDLAALAAVDQDVGVLKRILTFVSGSSDVLDALLEALFRPIRDQVALGNPPATDVAQALLTGILSGLLGTYNPNQVSDTTGTANVGAVGFPAGGLMGAGIEIALAPKDAFGFLQTTILDKLPKSKPLIGYISIRLCPKTKTLLGMQQWGPISVMIEVVAFGDETGRAFVEQLQSDAIAQIGNGRLDAMLHWGLENDQLTGYYLGQILALEQKTNPDPALSAKGDWLGYPNDELTKLRAFTVVRDMLRHANGLNKDALFRVFDSDFTTRLEL